MFDINTQVIVPTQTSNGHLTLMEALKYCASKDRYYELRDTLLYNIPLRDSLRSLGIKAFIKELKAIHPNNYDLAMNLDRFAAEEANEKLGNLDIQIFAISDSFTILGYSIDGLQELKDIVEMRVMEYDSSLHFDSADADVSQLHAGEYYENYPCFDSYDFANEDRTYQNYIIRKEPITEEELKSVCDIPSKGNYEKVNEDMPIDILPLVYYDGNSGYLKVATRKEDRLLSEETITRLTKMRNQERLAKAEASRKQQELYVVEKPKENSHNFDGDEYTKDILLKAETLKVFYKDEDDEASLVRDKYGRLWLYYTRWEELRDNQETYYSLVDGEEDARELFSKSEYWHRHRCPCFAMSSYGLFQLYLH